MKRTELTTSIFTISDVLTEEECHVMISEAETMGFGAATINAWDGPRLDTEARNNDRVIFDDVALAARLWTRVDAYVPRMRAGRHVRGLNERFVSTDMGRVSASLGMRMRRTCEMALGLKYVLRSDVMYGAVGQLHG